MEIMMREITMKEILAMMMLMTMRVVLMRELMRRRTSKMGCSKSNKRRREEESQKQSTCLASGVEWGKRDRPLLTRTLPAEVNVMMLPLQLCEQTVRSSDKKK